MGKLNLIERKEIKAAFDNYVLRVDFPSVAQFVSIDSLALKHAVTKANMLAWPEMQAGIDLCNSKAEAFLLQQGLEGKSAGMAIFILKQSWHGYSDRTDQNITSNGDKISFVNVLPRSKQAKKKSVAKGDAH